MLRLPDLRIGRLRVDRLALILLGAAVAATLVAALLAAALRLLRPGALPGVEVAGVAVGGLTEEDLRRRLTEMGRARAERRLRVVRPEAAGEPRESTSTTFAEAGYGLDVAATADEVMRRGRQANPYAALWDHLVAFGGAIEVRPEERVAATKAAVWARATARRLSVPPVEGDLRIEGRTVEAVYPAPGVVVPPRELAAVGRRAVLVGESEVTAPVEESEPRTDADDVDRLVAEAERALSAPVVLTRGGASLEISPEQIGRLLGVRREGDDLALKVRAGDLQEVLPQEDIARVEQEPQDASFSLVSGRVEVVPSHAGFRFAPRKAARTILELAARREDRRAQLPGEKVPPEFSTKDARALDISERVSSFTTYHPCCEPRVTNIHRIAGMVDGAVVKPGGSFSLNDHVGPRTEANGFVAAPAIRDGEFVDEVGGGISQFATTMFNAIYFGGYDFLEYQAHSYYIDRYPMGREATISTPAPDLAFRNDSDAGIYIDTSYTDTSITVTFYGNTDVAVDSRTGQPYNRKDPPEDCRVNRSLRRGEERVISEGRAGFDIVVERILVRGGERRVEEFFTRYQTEPRIVERRRCR